MQTIYVIIHFHRWMLVLENWQLLYKILNQNNTESQRQRQRGHMLRLHISSVLISITSALELVVGNNPSPRDTGQAWHPGYYSLLSPDFPRYPFTDQPKREDEQLGGLRAMCPGHDSNTSTWSTGISISSDQSSFFIFIFFLLLIFQIIISSLQNSDYWNFQTIRIWINELLLYTFQC